LLSLPIGNATKIVLAAAIAADPKVPFWQVIWHDKSSFADITGEFTIEGYQSPEADDDVQNVTRRLAGAISALWKLNASKLTEVETYNLQINKEFLRFEIKLDT